MKRDINKIEKFIIGRYDQSPMKNYPIKKFMTIASIVFGLATIAFLAVAHYNLLRIEHIDTRHFYWILAFIPFISILSIVGAKNTIRKADYSVKPHEAVLNKIVAVICAVTFMPLAWGLVEQNIAPIVSFIAYTAAGLGGVFLVTGGFYKVYLIRRYAPYFTDERLRRDSNGTG